MISELVLSPMMKPSTGIGRGHGKRGTKAGGGAVSNLDNMTGALDKLLASTDKKDVAKTYGALLDLYDKEGEAAVKSYLSGKSKADLHTISKVMGTAQTTRGWSSTERVSDYLLERIRARAHHGDAFRQGRGKTEDVTYKADTTVFGKVKSGRMVIGTKTTSDAFKAIYDSQPGTEITTEYVGFGSMGHIRYRWDTRGNNEKVLITLAADGSRRESYKIKSPSDIARHMRNARTITIHGRDFEAERREQERQSREFWAELERSWQKQQAKRSKG